MNQTEMLKIVQQFVRNDDVVDGKIKVMRVADSKTVYVETIGEIGRSIYMTEYQIDGNIYCAGHSSRSDTVYVSQVKRG